MSEERATLEIIAPTVEEALNKGLAELGLSRDMVEYEVLDEGGKGLLGIGGRQARIRLTVISPDTPAGVVSMEAEVTPSALDPESEVENVRAIAETTVTELLKKMDVNYQTTVSANITDTLGRDGKQTVVVDINGNDLSILIGRRAETLNALQYITRLIVGKEVGHGVNILVDVEGYRSRRERNLRQLARRMASQAIKSGRTQSLEPMPANERRIIHIELQGEEDVTTESVGEEPRRKVTIIPT